MVADLLSLFDSLGRRYERRADTDPRLGRRRQRRALWRAFGTSAAPPAGYPQTQSYSPSGYDPVFGALTVVAAPSNQLAAAIQVNGGRLANPLIVLRGYTHGSYPAHILLDGGEQAADKNYFRSLWTGEDQLWLTLNSTLGAGAHALTIVP